MGQRRNARADHAGEGLNAPGLGSNLRATAGFPGMSSSVIPEGSTSLFVLDFLPKAVSHPFLPPPCPKAMSPSVIFQFPL